MARQALEQFQQLDMVGWVVVEAVAASRGSGVPQIRRVAVKQFAPAIVILGQKPVREASLGGLPAASTA